MDGGADRMNLGVHSGIMQQRTDLVASVAVTWKVAVDETHGG